MGALVFLVSLGGSPQRGAPDAWLGQDKVKHFFTAAFVQGLGYGTLRAAGAPHAVAIGGATLATTGVSVWKEAWDAHGHGTPSGRDLVWDAAGAGSMSVLLVRVAR